MYKEIEALTKEFVAIPSVNGSPTGERTFAEHIEKRLRTLPYFAAHPDRVIFQEIGDAEHRANVFAYVRGEKTPKADTVILHGHFDTVDVLDYGSIVEDAFNVDALPEKIRALTDDLDVIADIDSGEWLFGRGVGDMKSGVAVHFAILKHFSEHPETLSGNILFLANPVEENQHTGIMGALTVFKQLRDEEGFVYKAAINTDMNAPLYPGDPAKYFMAGSAGKILPCFYVIGKPTHVSQYFEGFSADLTAAEIVRRLDGNVDFTESFYGEHAQPPTALKLKDLKPTYNVQTATAAFVYFNYFLMGTPINELVDRFKQIASDSLDATLTYTDAQFKKYAEKYESEDYTPINLKTQVLSYSELYNRVKKNNPDVDAKISSITAEGLTENLDRRELTLKIVEELCVLDNINIPTVVVFIAPPYCPTNTLRLEDADDKRLWDLLQEIVDEKAEEHGEVYKLVHFFTGLSDSSYIKMNDDSASVRALVDNFPDMKGIYNVPTDLIRELDIPAFDFGVYGKDAHKWTERVHAPYSFGKLPEIILTAIERLLQLT